MVTGPWESIATFLYSRILNFSMVLTKNKFPSGNFLNFCTVIIGLSWALYSELSIGGIGFYNFTMSFQSKSFRIRGGCHFMIEKNMYIHSLFNTFSCDPNPNMIFFLSLFYFFFNIDTCLLQAIEVWCTFLSSICSTNWPITARLSGVMWPDVSLFPWVTWPRGCHSETTWNIWKSS